MEYLVKHAQTTFVAMVVSYLFNTMVLSPLYEEKFASKSYVETKTTDRFTQRDHDNFERGHDRLHAQTREEVIARLDRIEARQQAFFAILSDWSRQKYGEELKGKPR